MAPVTLLANPECTGSWLIDGVHRAWLRADAKRQLAFFKASLKSGGGFHTLAWDGSPRPDPVQELHTTTRLIHSYALGKAAGFSDCDAVIDAGMDYLWRAHRDTLHGGYVWSLNAGGVEDGTKLAYGHVFVLLAGASAKAIGHPDADRLIAEVSEIIDRHYWDDDHGLLRDEFTREWEAFSAYRGMNANMHGVEAMLAAFEATGQGIYLERAGCILDFFTGRVAPHHDWRLPEHYHEDWTVDAAYEGNPMFRPRGTTPGHSFELGRLLIQKWDLSGRPEDGSLDRARKLIYRALEDAWLPEGGFCYTLMPGGSIGYRDRYWWPVTEAIGALATLLKISPEAGDEDWYRRLWRFADASLIDHEFGGWFPELGTDGRPVEKQFLGKPDIYHALQACFIPLAPGISSLIAELPQT